MSKASHSTRNRRYVTASIILVLLGAVAAVTGCGLKQSSDTAKGEQLYAQKCASCHTLAAAGSRGTIGPNLDDSFQASIESGLGRSTVKGVVLKQIQLPQGKEMPANLVKGEDATAVAEYVSQVVRPPLK